MGNGTVNGATNDFASGAAAAAARLAADQQAQGESDLAQRLEALGQHNDQAALLGTYDRWSESFQAAREGHFAEAVFHLKYSPPHDIVASIESRERYNAAQAAPSVLEQASQAGGTPFGALAFAISHAFQIGTDKPAAEQLQENLKWAQGGNLLGAVLVAGGTAAGASRAKQALDAYGWQRSSPTAQATAPPLSALAGNLPQTSALAVMQPARALTPEAQRQPIAVSQRAVSERDLGLRVVSGPSIVDLSRNNPVSLSRARGFDPLALREPQPLRAAAAIDESQLGMDDGSGDSAQPQAQQGAVHKLGELSQTLQNTSAVLADKKQALQTYMSERTFWMATKDWFRNPAAVNDYHRAIADFTLAKREASNGVSKLVKQRAENELLPANPGAIEKLKELDQAREVLIKRTDRVGIWSELASDAEEDLCYAARSLLADSFYDVRSHQISDVAKGKIGPIVKELKAHGASAEDVDRAQMALMQLQMGLKQISPLWYRDSKIDLTGIRNSRRDALNEGVDPEEMEFLHRELDKVVQSLSAEIRGINTRISGITDPVWTQARNEVPENLREWIEVRSEW